MELERLWLERFQGDRELEIRFATGHESSPVLRFLVGPNGSGKSRVLESLARIFSHLASGLGPEIGFELQYAIGGRTVLLTTREETVRALSYEGSPLPPRLDDLGIWLLTREASSADWILASQWPPPLEPLLPTRVVTLSSGPVSRFAWAVVHSREDRLRREMARCLAEPPPEQMDAAAWREHQRRQLEDLEADLRDLWDGSIALEVQPEDAILAMLAVLVHPAVEPAPAAREQLLDRVRLRTRRPVVAFVAEIAGDWRERVPELQRTTLERLRGLAARRFARGREEPDDGDETTPDESWVFAVDEQLGTRLRAVAETSRVLFEQLLAYKRRGAIQRVRLLLAQDGDGPVLDEDLSDGEFLLLGRYCTLTLLRDVPDCLVLLDEPETHFNDGWKIRLVHDLQELLGGAGSQGADEVLIATHSDLTLTDAERRDVHVFGIPEADEPGVYVAVSPDVSPLAADRRAIAHSVFGIPEGIGVRARAIVDDALESDDAEDLQATIERLGPGFSRFQVAHRLHELTSDDDAA